MLRVAAAGVRSTLASVRHVGTANYQLRAELHTRQTRILLKRQIHTKSRADASSKGPKPDARSHRPQTGGNKPNRVLPGQAGNTSGSQSSRAGGQRGGGGQQKQGKRKPSVASLFGKPGSRSGGFGTPGRASTGAGKLSSLTAEASRNAKLRAGGSQPGQTALKQDTASLFGESGGQKGNGQRRRPAAGTEERLSGLARLRESMMAGNTQPGSRVPLQGLFNKDQPKGQGGSAASGKGSTGAKPFLNMFVKPTQGSQPKGSAKHASREEEAFEKMRSQFAKIREQRENERKQNNVKTYHGRRVPAPGAQTQLYHNRRAQFELLAPTRRVRMTREERLKLPLLPREVALDDEMTVRILAQRMGINLERLLDHLNDFGESVKADDAIDADSAEIAVRDFGQSAVRQDLRYPSRVRQELPTDPAELAALPLRSPVVTVMGHVDHGKTTLLDCLRNASVTLSEAGGITQNIAAFAVPVDTVPVTMSALEDGATQQQPAGGKKGKKKGKKKAKKGKKGKATPGFLAPDEWITFLDTPGHALFSRMRSAGSAVTDVCVLVVAATDGVMPQTQECISLIVEAELPAVVAITKADMLGETALAAAQEKIAQQLLEHRLVTEEFGGEAQLLTVSAKTGEGMTELLEALQLQAEVLELKAPVKEAGEAVVLESTMATGLGPVVDALVRWGTLCRNDWVVAGDVYGKVKALMNDMGQSLQKAGPSMPVRVSGLKELPPAGVDLLVVKSEDEAEKVVAGRLWRKEREAQRITEARTEAEQEVWRRKRRKEKERKALARRIEFLERRRQAKLLNGEELTPELQNIPVMPEELLESDDEEVVGPVEIPTILKAAVHGSITAISDAIAEYPSDEVKLKVVQSGVGDITESEVILASTIGATIFAFNVKVPNAVQKAAEHHKVKIVSHDIIYRLIESVEDILSQHLQPGTEEVVTGVAEVKQVFDINRAGEAAAGCLVTSGELTRKTRYRLLRDGEMVAEVPKIASLKHFKDSVRTVKKGSECGVLVKGWNDFRQGDKLEAFEVVSVPRRIASMSRR